MITSFPVINYTEMNEIKTVFKVNNNLIKLNVKSERFNFGEEEVLFNIDKTPAHFAEWKDKGFIVTKFLDKNTIETFNIGIQNIVKDYLAKFTNVSNFSLDKYHEYVDDNIHNKVIEEIRAGSRGTGGISLDLFPIPVSIVEQRISEICGCNVSCRKTDTGYSVEHFWIRLIRPCSKDNNPPHRDVHLERSRGAVNLYFPIAGSNANSSLPIIPGSHYWPESEIVRTFGNTFINDIKYTNPATVFAVKGLEMITPNPAFDEVLVFTPYALHGGGVNLNKDTTRVSLEMRFWRI